MHHVLDPAPSALEKTDPVESGQGSAPLSHLRPAMTSLLPSRHWQGSEASLPVPSGTRMTFQGAHTLPMLTLTILVGPDSTTLHSGFIEKH